MIILLALTACAPEPASIKIDGSDGGSVVTIHAREGIPLRRAVVLDMDDKPLDPQPLVRWDVDNIEVAALNNKTLVPMGNGVTTVTAHVGEVKASYTVEVAFRDDEPRDGSTASYGACSVTSYGNGVVVLGCNDEDFPHGLSAYLADNGTLTVTAVSPLITYRGDHETRADSYLVVTKSF